MQRRSPQTQFTLAQYLAMEELAETRSEFFDGEIFALAGGTDNHSRMARNVLVELTGKLRAKGDGCEPFNSDMKVLNWRTAFAAYPDITVVCGPITPARPNDRTSMTNPQVIIEVLSPSTADFDRGGKFAAYRQLDTLQEFVLIHQDRALVEQYHREGSQWSFPQFTTTGTVTIAGCEVAVTDIYQDVVFEG